MDCAPILLGGRGGSFVPEFDRCSRRKSGAPVMRIYACEYFRSRMELTPCMSPTGFEQGERRLKLAAQSRYCTTRIWGTGSDDTLRKRTSIL